MKKYPIRNVLRYILNTEHLAMKLTFTLLLTGLFQMQAAIGYGQDNRVSITADGVPLTQVFQTIEDQTDFHFFYNSQELNVRQRVVLSATDKPVVDVLQSLFGNSSISYNILGNQIVLKKVQKSTQSPNVTSHVNPVESFFTEKMETRNPEVFSENPGKEFGRKTVAGIDVITKKTGAKGFVTVAASFPIDAYFDGEGNEMIPTLTTAMLSKGTTKNDKFQFSQKLEKLGVDIYVGSDSDHVTINFKCLSQDIDTVIALLAEELRHPLFDEKEFDLLKQQYIGNLQQGLSNPGMRGRIAMTQALYPKGHPNYSSSVETTIENIQNAELDDIIAFHKSYFGPKAMVLVGVGDVDEKTLYNTLEKNFKAWKGGMDRSQKNHLVAETVGQTKIITIPEKPSAELFIGQYTGIQRSDVDFLPLYIGNSVLGGGFSGRLMKTVRDDAGLTYGISSRLEGYTYSRGYWYINASFNPELLNKGKEMTLEQLRTWYQKGITAQELSDKKSNLIGSFKIGLSTTPGMASNILAVVQRGQAPGYIYEYPKELEAVTLEEVNAAIKKYIDIDNLVIVEAGSIDQNGNPME